MQPRPHGLGPLTISGVGFGAMQLPGPGVLGRPRDRAAAIAVLRRAVQLGTARPPALHASAQLALAWLLDLPPEVLLIPGTSSIRRLEQNMAAATIRLDLQARDFLA